jgi:DNA-3-methyladenine glycosylase II
MWFDKEGPEHVWADAARHLAKVDPKLAAIIRRVGPCTMAPRRDYFVSLCRAIYAQQLSTTVAAALVKRFRDEFPARRPTPASVHKLLSTGDEAAIRRCGLSRQKTKYLVDLAEHFLANKIATRRLRAMGDEQVIEALVQVKGIGRWTAEMFLIFVLNRPDVLPVDDLGLQEGVRQIYEMRKRPKTAQLLKLAEPWRPYRSIATWYVWRRNSVPSS